ncbi:fatty acid--CoA ligase [Pandoraea vervacti]|uniref:Fatty acid--CoA ligase n=2 Tax=Pandoraea vervacti TaxID=656178 RepID=A0ABM5SWA5_9BURK|nr:fatty acid--CoA ligase [Pandoraea vervacti]
MLPSVITIPRMLAQTVARYGDQCAIEAGGVRLRYRDLYQRALRAAAALISRGVEPGDRVAIWAPNGPEWIIGALGIHFCGASLIPINTRMRGAEVGYVLETTGANVLLSAGWFLGSYYPDLLGPYRPATLTTVVVMHDVRHGDIAWHDFLIGGRSITDDVVEARALRVSPEAISDIMFTSGTTGHPKGVMTTHAQNLRAIDGWADAMALAPTDRYLIVNPFFHAMGYKAGWLAALTRGATILPHRTFDTAAIFDAIEREKITVLPGPPTVFHSLLNDPRLASTDLSSLRATITGSTNVPAALIDRMRSELGFKVVLTGYGLTESSGFATLTRASDPAEIVANTCGRAMPGVELRIADERGEAAPAGVAGEVWIRGYNVMQGYLDNPDATREAIDAQGWLHTGDVGVIDEMGYLKITDRLKDMFIVGGFNCYPAEIERLAAAHPAVSQIAVVGVPDERMGEVGRAFVVLRPNAALDAAQFITWCRANMANYKVPRYVDFVSSLPTNPSGKVLKRELREWPVSVEKAAQHA